MKIKVILDKKSQSIYVFSASEEVWIKNKSGDALKYLNLSLRQSSPPVFLLLKKKKYFILYKLRRNFKSPA